jgi:hypothetical protein
MDTTTSNIKSGGLNETPNFYRNISGLPQINRTNSFGVVGSSIVPIVKWINTKIKFEPVSTLDDWQTAIVGHGLGKVYYTFTRWRISGSSAWTMCPQPNYDSPGADVPAKFSFEKIESSNIVFRYYDPLAATPVEVVEIEVDIYFIDIAI